jgi:predicted lipid-binding transport protein (Tim44 family)
MNDGKKYNSATNVARKVAPPPGKKKKPPAAGKMAKPAMARSPVAASIPTGMMGGMMGGPQGG